MPELLANVALQAYTLNFFLCAKPAAMVGLFYV
jgi:hypothetical protein